MTTANFRAEFETKKLQNTTKECYQLNRVVE
jgi:hypothetical protein